MQVATIHQLKKEMELLDPKELLQLCLRLAKFKKENKELLTYLLFESTDEEHFREIVKEEISEQVDGLNRSSTYYIKKSLRKTLRYVDKVIRFSGSRETEVELRLHFILVVKEMGLPIRRNRVLYNMYERQVDKIRKAMEKVHEDLQFDYGSELDEILTN